MREEMAILTIGICVRKLPVAIWLVRLDLVLMRVVAKVKRRVLFVLTVDRCRGPGVLDRQNQHQQNEK